MGLSKQVNIADPPNTALEGAGSPSTAGASHDVGSECFPVCLGLGFRIQIIKGFRANGA